MPAPDPSVPDLLERVLSGTAGAFALLHRPQSDPGAVEVLLADPRTCATLAELPLEEGPFGESLVLVPYRQLAERGYPAHDDGHPLVAMTVTDRQSLPLAEALTRLPDEPVKLDQGGFDLSDQEYADTVRRVLAEEIGTGQGANFVIRRTYTAWLPGYSTAAVLSFYRRLLERERGTHWTFLVHTGEHVLVGASPERHLGLRESTAVMNPISGTYCYPPGGATLEGVLGFLDDRKEAEELSMVVDEELKMMARICPEGPRLIGPRLKEMTRLAHTEYLIEGRTGHDVRHILRETMFAPTVTGSPLENAAAVIARHEPTGRGYYSGIAALIGRDARGGRILDSTILIRTADLTPDGRLSIGVGATLVRHSRPEAEARETRVKASALLAALTDTTPERFATHPDVQSALGAHQARTADFWTAEPARRSHTHPVLAGRSALLVDAEDTFTAMLAQQVGALGLDATVRRHDDLPDPDGYDLLILGPGPGDPRDPAHPAVTRLTALLRRRLTTGRPLFAVCLSHQVLAAHLGLPLVRRTRPHQGVRRGIDLYGRREHVGFYNTYAARADRDTLHHPQAGPVTISRDPGDGEVHALRGPHFASVQFHAESVLTQDGPRILGSLLAATLTGGAR
ncbi:anthranilate synthase family protein [Streptomyces sp. NRRL WC-3742]|uniref:anthranilate synthase family protein n=1 Tax=Streptomyces sp. NRRL WC-3742 TaxID=1463934 RepID=UPI0004C80882|nr:anthranilate synthase family protein [Streptomyces sp. NRRL WC-3742]